MRKLNRIIGTIAISMSLSGIAFAIPMGEIKINLDTSAFSFDDTSIDFEQPSSGIINDASGDFVSRIDDPIEFKDFNYASFPAGGIANLWSIIGDGISFSLMDLLYANYAANGSAQFLTLYGQGWLHIDGESDAWASWTLSADEVGGVYNFSSSTNTPPVGVPDSGTTNALLGFALLGFVVVSSRMKRAKQSRAVAA